MDTKAITETGANLPTVIPDYGPGVGGRGNEGIDQDRIVPLIQLLQKGNPQVDEDSDQFIDGAKIGQLLNTATGEVFDEIIGVPFFREQKVVEWKKRELGGGGPFNSFTLTDDVVQRAMTAAGLNRPIGRMQHPDIAENELQETKYVGLIQLDAVGGNIIGAVIVPFKSMGLPAWNKWASRYGGTRFGGQPLTEVVDLFCNQVTIGSRTGENEYGTFKVLTVTPAVGNNILSSLLPAGHQAVVVGAKLNAEYGGGRVKMTGEDETTPTGDNNGDELPF